MTKIYQVSGEGVGCPPQTTKGFTLMNIDPSVVTEGQMDLLIARDNMLKKRDIAASKIGIGAIKTQKFHNSADVFTEALMGLNSPDPEHYMAALEEDILAGRFSMETEMNGIGAVEEIGRIRKARSLQRHTERLKRIQHESVSGIGAKKKSSPSKTKTGAFLKKAAKKTAPALKNFSAKVKATTKATAAKVKATAKKVTKAALKVATAPQRLLIKGILEITLPKAAPFFLYLFINDPAIIAKLPAKVKRKRDKSLKAKNFIVNVIGMKDAHFMGIVRNGIMKQLGASPETIISRQITKVSGIGIALAAATTALPFVIEIIQKLASMFKKNKEETPEVSKDDAPDDSDFETLSPMETQQLSSEVKRQNDLPEPGEDAPITKNVRPAQDANPTRFNNENGSGQQQGRESSTSQGGENESPENGSEESQGSEAKTAKQYNDTDETGEIKKQGEFSTGGRKGWNSLG